MDPKKPWKSKTLWANFLLAGCALFIPGAEQWISDNPVIATLIGTVVNMLLRLITKEPVTQMAAASVSKKDTPPTIEEG